MCPKGADVRHGLPVGVTLDGPEGTDDFLLAIGLALEAREPALPAPPMTVPA
jgi:Asp-tRNA(Asn)/Glu-tRNA(Gln) amidotransferase A subunit family amidase